MVPFDPESSSFPPALEALFARPAATIPAVLLVAGPAARRGGWAARAAVSIATGWAERGGRLVLADLAVESPALHLELGDENAEGLADIFEFGASLARVARVVPDRQFRFLAAGVYASEPETLLGHPRWDRLIDEFAEDQGTLLAFVPAETPGLDALARRVGRVVILAGADEAERVAGPFSAGGTIELRLIRPAASVEGAVDAENAPAQPPEAAQTVPGGRSGSFIPPFDPNVEDPGAEDDDINEPGFVRRRPARRRWRIAPVIWILLAVALGLGGWYAYKGSSTSRTTPPVEEADSTKPAEPATSVAREARPIDSPIPYSVAIEAHQDMRIAQERAISLREAEPGVNFYVSPIVNPSDSLIYFRVLAGPAADTASANALMQRLVGRGHKTEAAAWAVRPTAWAYQLGDFDDRGAADARMAELLREGVPTYLVEMEYTSGLSRYRIYAGAYEGHTQAEVMGEILLQAGITAPLVRRSGKPAA